MKLYDGGALIGLGIVVIMIGMCLFGVGVHKVNKERCEKEEAQPKIMIVRPKPAPEPVEEPKPEPVEEPSDSDWKWWPF